MITDNIALEFIDHYREAFARNSYRDLDSSSKSSRNYIDYHYLDQIENSREQILAESKLFMLYSALVDIINALWIASTLLRKRIKRRKWNINDDNDDELELTTNSYLVSEHLSIHLSFSINHILCICI